MATSPAIGITSAIEKGYAGIIQNLIKPDGENRWSLTQCCSVAGLGGSPSNGQMRDGSFSYYVARARGQQRFERHRGHPSWPEFELSQFRQ